MKARFWILTLFFLMGIFSCKPGSGGDATIVAFPQHHGKPIYGVTMYVKYNATEFPGANVGNYDTKFVGNVTEDFVNCTGLKAGKYYLYAVGYDPSIAQVVSGGIAVKVKYSQRKKDININVPVTE